MGTWIIGGLVIGAMVLAGVYSWKKQRRGECPGCSSGGSCSCCHVEEPAKDKK